MTPIYTQPRYPLNLFIKCLDLVSQLSILQGPRAHVSTYIQLHDLLKKYFLLLSPTFLSAELRSRVSSFWPGVDWELQ